MSSDIPWLHSSMGIMGMKISAQVDILIGDDVKVECENQVKEQPTRK